MPNIVELSTIPVMCIAAVDGAEGVPDAVTKVEEKLGHNLRGRKCYGVSITDESGLHYRACVAIRDGDDPAALGLEPSVIPGGKYVQDRIRPFDYRKDIPDLVGRFERMSEESDVDGTRPFVEFYRRHDDVKLYVPIK